MMFTDLPHDVESEILSRVPATSLTRLRSTCKRWYSLFKDSNFIKRNLHKAESKVVLKNNHRVYSVSINHHVINNNFGPSVELTSKLKSLRISEHVRIHDIFHCDGLFLCASTNDDSRFVVWNPCTGQIRWTKNKPTNIRNYFLGYENNNNNKSSCHSYKILSISSDHYILPAVMFAIYEFNTDSWRVLDDVTRDWRVESNGVTLKGNAYCVAKIIEEPFVRFMLKFDFTTERFGRLSLPFQSGSNDNHSLVLSVVREEKLALLRLDFNSFELKIWLTDNKTEEDKDLSWSDFFVLDFSKFMLYRSRRMSFLVDEENTMVMYCCADTEDYRTTRIYIVGEHMHQQIYSMTDEDLGSKDYNPFLVSYVPSLVQIPIRQSHHGGKRKR